MSRTYIDDFYAKYFGFTSIHEHQIKMWERLENYKAPTLLRAPTGSGKTEAILAPFLFQYLKKDFFLAPRLIYVLPMRVIVNSLTERIRKYASKISTNISVSAQHGDLPHTPFFMSDVVVTTLDQFVYAFARTSRQVGRHIDVPAGAIASSLVVFDEAHMYRDEFTFSIMRALMEILYHSRIPFVVMTATMPESLERSLFENIPIDETHKISGNLPVSSELNLQVMDEPLVTDDEVNLSDEILKRIKEKNTLIVLNQVKRAQRVYEEIKRRLGLEYGQIVLLHSRFTRIDRKKHEERALSIIPHKKDGELEIPESAGIVVSTQVLEAGIDFSAELLLTELSPADSLVQRAGRCARYEGESGEMIIFPVEGDRPHLPYEKRHLEKTKEWLSNNKSFNIKDFTHVCEFVNQTLDYRANDFEAVDTLIDLYECVLYADEKPENIQVRKDKSAKVIVVEPKIGDKRKESKEDMLRNGIMEILRNGSLVDYTFEVDIKVLWGWFREGLIRYELQWKSEDERKGDKHFEIKDLKERGREVTEEDPAIAPFKTYILESSIYNPEKGVTKDEAVYM